MKVYILNHVDRYDCGFYSSYYFTSEEERSKFLERYLKKFKFFRRDMELDEEELNPDSSWMKEED